MVHPEHPISWVFRIKWNKSGKIVIEAKCVGSEIESPNGSIHRIVVHPLILVHLSKSVYTFEREGLLRNSLSAAICRK